MSWAAAIVTIATELVGFGLEVAGEAMRNKGKRMQLDPSPPIASTAEQDYADFAEELAARGRAAAGRAAIPEPTTSVIPPRYRARPNEHNDPYWYLDNPQPPRSGQPDAAPSSTGGVLAGDTDPAPAMAPLGPDDTEQETPQ